MVKLAPVIPDRILPMNNQVIVGAKANNKKSKEKANKEVNNTGLLPYLSLKFPMTGAKMNWVIA